MSKHLQTNPVVQYYWRHVRVYRGTLWGLIISVPITILLNGYIPTVLVASVLGKLSSQQYHASQLLGVFGPYLAAYTVLMLVGMLLWRLVDNLMWHLEANMSRDMAEEVFEHMLRETADFHANHFSGSLVSQANKLLGSYIRAADTTIFQVYPMLAGIIISAVILITRAPLFVLLLIIFAVFFLTTALIVSRPVQRQGAIFSAIESKQTGYLADAIANAMAVKSFARGNYERIRFHKATTDTFDNLFLFARMHRKQLNWLGILGRSTSAMSLTMVAVSVLVFHSNIGTAFLILSYTANIVDQLFQFSNNSIRNYNRTLGDAADMVAILNQKPKIIDPKHPEPLHISRGDITFDQVGFQHDGAGKAIFRNLNLHIKAGEKVGLVGHSGSGKTTLTRLLLRFSDIQHGKILIDGQDITHITQDDLHTKIAYVPQESVLFHRTLKENIGYGDIEASDQQIHAVAKLAHSHDFISALPDGYETLVGERGIKLSGGQRQRIAIARAMLKNAPILVLDEATASLDSESEAYIQDALWTLMEGRTAIVVAHRLSTIQKMDRIIVLDDGEIIEQGSHKELLRQNGQYAALWARQSGGFIEE